MLLASGLHSVILFGGLPPVSTTPGHPVRKFPVTHIARALPTVSAPSFAPSPGLTGVTPDVPPEEVVIMTGLQIAMSREIFGWPLYSLVMAAGQVR